MPLKQSKFCLKWLEDEKYKWLQADESSPSIARCKACLCTIELSNMGKRSLDSHATSKKHQMAMKDYKVKDTSLLSSWVVKQSDKSKDSATQSTSSGTSSEASSSNSLLDLSSREVLTKADILWTVNTIVAQQSFNSTEPSSALFPVMFPDSDYAKKFSSGPD